MMVNPTDVNAQNERGFLLITVVGVLAALLVLCVGFLSMTRSELSAVSSVRDRCDTEDLARSALDWAIANVSSDLCANNGFDPGAVVSVSTGADGRWWYTPYEMGLANRVRSEWWGWTPSHMAINKEAPWIYAEPSFYAEGGVRGRFSVLLLDANAMVNINDWNEDGCPTQAQMAHMFIDAYDYHEWDRWRAFRDLGIPLGWNGDNWKSNPLRYEEAWRAVTHTTRYLDWAQWFSEAADNVVSPNWVTENSCWLGLYGPDMASIHPIPQSVGICQHKKYPANPRWDYNGSAWYYPPDPPNPGTNRYDIGQAGGPAENRAAGPNNFVYSSYAGSNQDLCKMPYYLSGFGLMAYTDPDTGRSPININTIYNSGEQLPLNRWPSARTYTMEAVFNVESLRRIIKVGQVQSIGKDAQVQWANMTAAEKLKVERLKTQLAYRYQEMLCRYFTGTYSHRGRPGAAGIAYGPDGTASSAIFPVVYPGIATLHHCSSTDYTATRFNTDLRTFREWVKDDLLIMCQGMPEVVDFGAGDIANIPMGRMDRRSAAAVYDNIVPGKPDLRAFGVTSDPLTELSALGVARQEDFDDAFNVYGHWTDNPNLTAVSRWSPSNGYPNGAPINMKDSQGGDLTLRPKGRDIRNPGAAGVSGPWNDTACARQPPYRQKVFSSDCFSTELTTTSTTFICVVNAQLVERASVDANPGNPALHRILSANQWGVVFEIAPDVFKESNTEQYYANNLPMQYKCGIDPTSGSPYVDDACSSRVTVNRYPTGPSGERVVTNSTAILDWRSDLRGITPEQAGRFYNNSEQTRKRVIIRSIWCLNQGIMR